MGKRTGMVIALAMSALLSAHAATASLERVIDAVVRNGPDSQLPAHLSVVLGVAKVEQGVAVKQAVMREGSTVHTFNVCAANHDEVVLIHYDEKTRAAKAYRVSAAGKLRSAVEYQAGAPANVRLPAEARSDFAGEIKYWMDFARKQAPHQ